MNYNNLAVFYSPDKDVGIYSEKPKLEFKLRPIEDVKRELAKSAKTVEARVQSILNAKYVSQEDLRREITI